MRQSFVRLHAFILVGILLVSMLGSLGLSQSVLRIGAEADAESLDSRLVTSLQAAKRISIYAEPLLIFTETLELEPRLATSWQFSDDGLQLTFLLRDNATFHHGTPFTARDVKYTFDWVLNENNSSPNRSLYLDIAEIETPDDYTVIFHLNRPNGFLINNLARLSIVPHDRGDDPDFGMNPSGTGPYHVDSWQRDERMILTAVDNYWGEQPRTDKLEFYVIPEAGARLLAFEAGEIDVTQDALFPLDLERLEQTPGYVVQRSPGTGYTYVGMNTLTPGLDDVLVRKALNHVIPRAAIVSQILNGVGQVGSSIMPPTLPWFNPDVVEYDYNPELARELLDEAGFTGGSFTLYTNENTQQIQMAEILQFEFQQLGVDLAIMVEESSAFLERIQQKGDFDMFISTWTGMLDADRAMYRQFHSEGGRVQYTNWSTPELDVLLARGPSIPGDSAESVALYQQAQAIVVDASVYVVIFYHEEIGLSHDYVRDWQLHPNRSFAYQSVHLVGVDR